MKKSQIATVASMPRTSPEAMAAKVPEKTEEDKMRDGGYDLEHLMKAEEIKSDPDRMDYVQKAHATKSKAMRSIADLKVAGAALAQQAQDDARAKAAQPREKTRYPKRGQ